MGKEKTEKTTTAAPRKTAAQKKVEAITEKLQAEGYAVVAGEDGKYGVKKAKGRKLLSEGLTVAGLESYAASLVKPENAEASPEQINEAIASEATTPQPVVTSILHESDPTDHILKSSDPMADYLRGGAATSEVSTDESEDDEVIEDVAWEIGKGKADIFPKQKKLNGAHAHYKGKDLYLVEAQYSPGLWAVYIGKACVASSMKGLDFAKAAAIQAADKLIAAEESGDFLKAREILDPPHLETEKGKDKKKPEADPVAATSTEEVEKPSPADNPNTNPETAKMLHNVFKVPRVAELIGDAVAPNQQAAEILAKLDPLQRQGLLTVIDLCFAMGKPPQASRLDIALYWATNGVEVKFLGGDRVELTTTAPPITPITSESVTPTKLEAEPLTPPVESLEGSGEADDSFDVSRFL